MTGDELDRAFWRVDGRLRRAKRRLERRNPLDDLDAYTAAFAELVELEARRRDLQRVREQD